MSTEVRWRRGSTAEHASFTGAPAEVTVDTTKKTLVVHDGTTPGGIPLAREDSVAQAITTGYSPSVPLTATNVQEAIDEVIPFSTNFAGPSAPPNPIAFMTWADTGNNVLKRRNAANTAWVIEGKLLDLSYSQGNIVGVVSQTSGIPTGAILESGINANGGYRKFADGSLEQRGVTNYTFNNTSALDISQFFPVSFNSNASIIMANQNGLVGGKLAMVYRALTNSPSNMIVSVASLDGTVMAGGSSFNWVAIGRWYT